MAPTRIRKVKKPKDAALPQRLRARKSPSQKRARDLVSAVLEAGSRILLERGYEKLSMQQVATVAGVSPGSLYQYFPDKASLVAAIVEGISKREVAFQLEHFARLSPGATLAQALQHVLQGVVVFQRHEGPLMRRGFEALQHLGRYAALSNRVAEVSGGLRLLLEAHRDEVTVKDLELATHVLVNAIHSLTHDGVLARPASLDDDTLVRELMRLSMGYLRG
jgi:AcrR family transcriptional regulator